MRELAISGGALLLLLNTLAPSHVSAQHAGTASICSDEHVLLDRALADTFRVDDGVAFSVLSSGDESLHGQLFVVEDATPPLANDTVVLVRWNPSPDSPPLWPDASTRWLPTGVLRLVYGALRTAAHWTSAMPTLDVKERSFPDGKSDREQEAAHRGMLMTPDELFDFCTLQVDDVEVSRGNWNVDHDPMDWARKSDGQWRRYPAATMLYGLAARIERSRVLNEPADIRGTWAVRVLLPSGRELRTFLRTADKPSDVWFHRYPDYASFSAAPWDVRATGYEVVMWSAQVIEDLPRQEGTRRLQPCRHDGIIYFDAQPQVLNDSCIRMPWGWKAASPLIEGPGIGQWAPELLTYMFPDDAEVAEVVQEWSSAFATHSRAGEQLPSLGEFRANQSSLSYDQEERVSAARWLRFHALRISRGVVAANGVSRPDG